jgi:hypothetical protein
MFSQGSFSQIKKQTNFAPAAGAGALVMMSLQ